MGLGDLFVVRNAGQVTGESIMGTIWSLRSICSKFR